MIERNRFAGNYLAGAAAVEGILLAKKSTRWRAR